MCHRFNVRSPASEIAAAFNLPQTPQLEFPETDRYPGSDVLTLRLDSTGARELSLLEWGLLPRWWKPSAKFHTRKSFQRNTFNARSETIHEKPSFRDAFKKRRALIPASEFYEGGHYFGLVDQPVFALAGLWEAWRLGDDAVETCTVVTTEANSLIAKYHARKRMPVILQSENDIARWLNPEITSRDDLLDLFEPFDAGMMTCTPAES